MAIHKISSKNLRCGRRAKEVLRERQTRHNHQPASFKPLTPPPSHPFPPANPNRESKTNPENIIHSSQARVASPAPIPQSPAPTPPGECPSPSPTRPHFPRRQWPPRHAPAGPATLKRDTWRAAPRGSWIPSSVFLSICFFCEGDCETDGEGPCLFLSPEVWRGAWSE